MGCTKLRPWKKMREPSAIGFLPETYDWKPRRNKFVVKKYHSLLFCNRPGYAHLERQSELGAGG